MIYNLELIISGCEIITKTNAFLLRVLLSRNIFGRKIIMAIQKNVNMVVLLTVNHVRIQKNGFIFTKN